MLNELELFAGGNMKKQYIYGTIKPCQLCGISFQSRDADSSGYTSKYCSHACRNKDRVKHKEKPCVYCLSSFKPRRDGHMFCSRKCSAKHKSETHIPSQDVLIRKRMAAFCCGVIHRCLRGKNEKTEKMLGYSCDDLKNHLENHFQLGMTWENYGNCKGQWSIDHTKPISVFSKESSVMEINALSNLRPMWHSLNCSKKNKWEGL